MSSAFAIINICMKIKREFFLVFIFSLLKERLTGLISERLIDHIECVTLLKTNDVSRVKLENQN